MTGSTTRETWRGPRQRQWQRRPLDSCVEPRMWRWRAYRAGCKRQTRARLWGWGWGGGGGADGGGGQTFCSHSSSPLLSPTPIPTPPRHRPRAMARNALRTFSSARFIADTAHERTTAKTAEAPESARPAYSCACPSGGLHECVELGAASVSEFLRGGGGGV